VARWWAWLLVLALLPGADCKQKVGRPGGGSGVVPLVARCPYQREPEDREVVRLRGRVYVTRGARRLRYDYTRPVGRGPFPLVLLVHGGAWAAGKREEMNVEASMLAAEGIAAASVDYRLAVGGKNHFPAAIQDVRCALEVLRSQAAALRLDPRRVLAAGVSSGGHLAALLATAAHDPRLTGPGCPAQAQSVAVQGAVLFYAPLDLRQTDHSVRRDIIENFLGAAPDAAPALADLASPLHHLRRGAPPMLLVHGTHDEAVPVEQSRAFYRRMKALGVPGRYIEVDAGHGFFMFKGQRPFARARCTTMAFIHKVLGVTP